MKKKITLIIRIILSIILIVLIYRETGVFTSIFAGTMTIYTEIDNVVRNGQKAFNDEVIKYINRKQ
jgi:hypothetical protein